MSENEKIWALRDYEGLVGFHLGEDAAKRYRRLVDDVEAIWSDRGYWTAYGFRCNCGEGD